MATNALGRCCSITPSSCAHHPRTPHPSAFLSALPSTFPSTVPSAFPFRFPFSTDAALRLRPTPPRKNLRANFLVSRCNSAGRFSGVKCFAAARKSRRDFDDFIDPAKQEPPEIRVEDEGLTKFDRVEREAQRIRDSQREERERTRPIFLKAVGIDPDEYKEGAGGDGDLEPEFDGDGDGDGVGEEGVEGDSRVGRTAAGEDDDFYNLLDMAVANMKRPAGRRKGRKGGGEAGAGGEAEAEGLEGESLEDERDENLGVENEYEENLEEGGEEEYLDEEDYVDEGEEDDDEEEEDEVVDGVRVQRDLEDDGFGLGFEDDYLEEERYMEPSYRLTLGELLKDAGVAPLAVYGDLDVEVHGIQHDSRQVNSGDMFVCCPGIKSDGHQYISDAVDRGASVLVVSDDSTLNDANVRACVVVEDTNSILSALAAAFFDHPSRKLSVIGITGTNGKTTTSMLLRSIYETMRIRTGLLGTIAYYINSDTKLNAPHTTPDAVYLQRLMAQMVEAGTEACAMEVSSHALALDRCKEVDFDVAVFTNFTRDHMDFHETEQEYMEAKGKLFEKMTDPNKHRKVVNIDDPNAPYFISQGSPDVPVITFSLENTDADVYPLEVQLSLFETELLVRTPKGNVEISSGLLGRHNVYNILASVAVGIAVEAPLKHIVRGIEEVDAIPGRCELVDEEQAFAVIVDYAHTPDALARLLDTVRECGAQRVITVVGCGGDRDRGKRPIMGKIATEKSDVCIFTSDNPRTEEPLDIIDDMLAGVGWSMAEYLKWGETDYYPPLPNGHRLFVYDVRTIAVRAGVAMGEEGDAVVIAGKGHETYQIVGTKEEYFNDREECREALQHLDALHAAGVDTSEFPWRVLEST